MTLDFRTGENDVSPSQVTYLRHEALPQIANLKSKIKYLPLAFSTRTLTKSKVPAAKLRHKSNSRIR